ncbi:hypothetical protein KR009_008858 [Drosophila setifemur]|nr:hypothetical protein KR009_008858 [Drosophila setifemur]
MIFRNEKKRDLWRYASRNNPGTRYGAPSISSAQPERPPPPPHRPRPHYHSQQSFGYPGSYEDSSSLAMRQTPPPPYSCAMDCSGSSNCQNLSQSQSQSHNNNNNNSHPYRRLPNHKEAHPHPDAHPHHPPSSCGSVSAGENSDPGDDMLIEGSDRELSLDRDRDRDRDRLGLEQVHQLRTNAKAFATMFRNCCGGASTDQSSNGSTTTIPAGARTPVQHQLPQNQPYQTPAQLHTLSLRRTREDFDALMKLLQRKQIAELLLAVKSRVDLPTRTTRDAGAITSTTTTTTTPTYLQCILADRDQHVIACRLFFWSDLQGGEELKRLPAPACPSASDTVYKCCNPLHWFRILTLGETESQLPPYQRSKMQRLKDADSEEDSQNVAKSAALSTWSARSSSISSVFKLPEEQPSLFESLTTDGKDHTINAKGWCQIAYWELAHRVGEFFHAKTSAVNIYTDGIVDSGGDSMCLRVLSEAGNQIQSEDVQRTRQKVGLGVTLSLERGDVWIYNRTNVPVFVGSPTLTDHLDRPCKVWPGYCLKAFETNRAQMLSMSQGGANHMGPIDWFSIKISFAKGWGHFYHRQDIMGCPCWVDVHFSHLR